MSAISTSRAHPGRGGADLAPLASWWSPQGAAAAIMAVSSTSGGCVPAASGATETRPAR
jgi:hypothetical protein